MTKRSGIGAALILDSRVISNDVGSFSIGCPIAQIDMTGIDSAGMERVGGVREATVSADVFFNDATDRAHDALSGLPTADRYLALPVVGVDQGNPVFCMVGPQIDYAGNRGADGELKFSTSPIGNGYGGEWGDVLSEGLTTSTGSENLASIDYGATPGATTHGLQAYIWVTAFTGTSATIAIEDSSNDSTFASISGASFTVTGTGAQRVQTGRTEGVDRYLRIAVSGTFTTVSFLVAVNKNLTATTF